MPTTSNFGWTTPADTDLVKDGAAAIRTLGNGIDSSLVDLKGGTTGQILSKASNTDLDYTWIANDQGDITEVQAGTGISVASGTGPVPVVTNSMATEITAKGDLIVGTGSGTFDNLPVGTNGYTLVADSSVSPTGLKWAVDPVADVVTTAGDLIYGTAADTVTRLGIGTAGQVLKVNSGATAPEWGAGGGGAFTKISTTSFSNVASQNIDNLFSSTYNSYLVVISTFSASTGSDDALVRFRYGSTTETSLYYGSCNTLSFNATNTLTAINNANAITMSLDIGGAGLGSGWFYVNFPNGAGSAGHAQVSGMYYNSTGSAVSYFGAAPPSANNYTGLNFLSSSSNVTGTVTVFGVEK